MTPHQLHPASPLAMCAAIRHSRKTLCRRLDDTCAQPDEQFTYAFGATVAAVESVFRHEELIMETLGYERLHEHREENAVILTALHRVMPQVEGGDCALGRQVATALRDVISLHRLSTDLALAVAPHTSRQRAHGHAARTTLHVPNQRRHVH